MNWLSGVSIVNRGQVLAWGLVAVLLAGLAGTVAGYRFGTARGDARVAQLTADYRKAQIDAVAATEADRNRKQALADRLAVELAATQADLHAAQIKLTQRVSNVTTVYLPASSVASEPVPIPRTVFTTGFVQLWDAANGIDLPAPGEASCSVGGEAGIGETVGPECLRDSGISQAEILTNHIDNAMRCRAIEATLDKYIQFYRETSGD